MRKLCHAQSFLSPARKNGKFWQPHFPSDAADKEATRLLTNLEMAVPVLSKRCQGNHRHAHLVHGRAAAAQAYPRALCEGFLESLSLEMKKENLLCSLGALEDPEDELHVKFEMNQSHWDELDGTLLDPGKVCAGMKRELVDQVA